MSIKLDLIWFEIAQVQNLRETVPFDGIFSSKLPQDAQGAGLYAPRFDGTWKVWTNMPVPKEIGASVTARSES